MSDTKNFNKYFYGSLLLAVWFALTGFLWTYFANIFISFPFGILSLYIWNKGRQVDPNTNRYRIILSILIAGLVVSLLALLFFK